MWGAPSQQSTKSQNPKPMSCLVIRSFPSLNLFQFLVLLCPAGLLHPPNNMSHYARRTHGAGIHCKHVRPSSGGSNPCLLVQSKFFFDPTTGAGVQTHFHPGHTLSDCLCLAQQTPWLGPPLESLSQRQSAPRESVSGAPAMLGLPRHPAVTSHTAACCRIVRCRQRQCHCHRRAQRAPTQPLTFTLSPSMPPSVPRSFSSRLFQDMAAERVKALQETP